MQKVNVYKRQTFECWKVNDSLELIELLADNGFTQIELQGMDYGIELTADRIGFVFISFQGFPAFVINRRNSITWDLRIFSEKDFANSEYYLD